MTSIIKDIIHYDCFKLNMHKNVYMMLKLQVLQNINKNKQNKGKIFFRKYTSIDTKKCSAKRNAITRNEHSSYVRINGIHTINSRLY